MHQSPNESQVLSNKSQQWKEPDTQRQRREGQTGDEVRAQICLEQITSSNTILEHTTATLAGSLAIGSSKLLETWYLVVSVLA